MREAQSLQALFPQLSLEWDAEKNVGLTPGMVAAHSHRRVWWRCPEGHSWQAGIASRVSGCGCPVCANRVILEGYNDLATTHPHLAAQWHPARNKELTPERVSAGYDKKVWWICEQGHAWQAAVKTRVRENSGCPVCANYVALAGYNDLRTLYPAIADQWHPDKNGSLSPEQVVAGSSRRVWWLCPEGHVWRTAVYNRAGRNKQTGCPVCAGNYKVRYRQQQYKEMMPNG